MAVKAFALHSIHQKEGTIGPGQVIELDDAEFERLEGFNAVREATDEEVLLAEKRAEIAEAKATKTRRRAAKPATEEEL